jgi:hypothetical protein
MIAVNPIAQRSQQRTGQNVWTLNHTEEAESVPKPAFRDSINLANKSFYRGLQEL